MVEVFLNLVNICFWFRSSRVFYLCLPSIAYQKDHYFIANMLEILFNTDEFLINLLVARYVSSIAFEMKLSENLNFQFSVMNENIQFSCYCFCIIWVFYNFGNCVSPGTAYKHFRTLWYYVTAPLPTSYQNSFFLFFYIA